MTSLIGVTGYKNSGKNAVCNVLLEEFGYTITGFADVLKSMALALDPIVYVVNGEIFSMTKLVNEFGWDVAKEEFPEVRRILQKLGTECVREHLGQNIWIEAWHRNVRNLLAQGQAVCVSDVRFINEARAIRDLGGEIWRVYRPETVATGHASETELDEIESDLAVHNTGDLAELAEKIRWMQT